MRRPRQVTRHTSHVTRHTSHVTRHTSHVTRHTSHVTRHAELTRVRRRPWHAHPCANTRGRVSRHVQWQREGSGSTKGSSSSSSSSSKQQQQAAAAASSSISSKQQQQQQEAASSKQPSTCWQPQNASNSTLSRRALRLQPRTPASRRSTAPSGRCLRGS